MKNKKKLSGLDSFQPITDGARALATFWEFVDGWNSTSEDVQSISSFGRVRLLRYEFPDNQPAAPLYVVEWRKREDETGAPRRWGGLPSIDSGVKRFVRREVVRFVRGEFFQIPLYIEKGKKGETF